MPQPKLSKLEFKIMETLWTKSECSIRDIQESFPLKKRPAYTTIQTTVYRMEAKGVVHRLKKVGNFHIFSPAISRDAAQRRLMDDLLNLFGGSAQPVMTHLIESGKLSLDDVKDAERLLRNLSKERECMTPGLYTPEWTPSLTAALINHLWQSTAVLLVAWLLTLSLRPNPARVRYAIWMIASIKFLFPFALLTSLGARWATHNPTPQVGPSLQIIVEEISQPFRQGNIPDPGAATLTSTSHSPHLTSILLAAVWICGFLAALAIWIVRWRRAAAMARNATPVATGREFDALRYAERNAKIKKPIPLVFSSSDVEPGIFGVMRPVLLWPIGLSDRLDDIQIQAIMAHEVEHVRRRDNLTVAIHAFVEALFWFHPLVRWMSAKMNEERERACDEKVIEQNARPEAYAESILKVCAFCMEPPTPCVSGVSGADLKERILRIMTSHSGVALTAARKLALSATAVMILVAPLGFGVLRGQAPSATPRPRNHPFPALTCRSSKWRHSNRTLRAKTCT